MSAAHGNLNKKAGFEEDVGGKASAMIWVYFVLLGLSVFVVIWGTALFFDFEVEKEMQRKIGAAQSKELRVLREHETAVLTGNKALFEGKESISIEDAKNRLLSTYKNPSKGG